jgi:uncharacterized OsmC-like protein
MTTSVSVDSAATNYLETVRASGHLIQVDEPVSAGGMDAGPSPYELLLGALGTCKAITVRMYAARKGWPLESVRVNLSHDRRHAEDCLKCQDTAAQIDHIDVQIEFVGPALSASQRQTLLAVAEKCPIHRTLTGGVQIRTRALGPVSN